MYRLKAKYLLTASALVSIYFIAGYIMYLFKINVNVLQAVQLRLELPVRVFISVIFLIAMIKVVASASIERVLAVLSALLAGCSLLYIAYIVMKD